MVNGKEVNYGIPYGSIPRLILCWMCTEAVRTNEPKLHLGSSLAAFMEAVKIGSATGGRWGSIARVKDQLRRLFNARISYRWRGAEAVARKSMEITSEEVLWWSTRSSDQPALFDSYIILGDAFFQDIVTRPVPVKLEALQLLKRSPLALDLYTWTTFRMFSLRKPTALSWKSLQRQLGAEYTSTDEFARKCRKYLKQIVLVYPELRVEFPRGRLLLAPSATHVGTRPRRAAAK